MSIEECRPIEFPVVPDHRGNLAILEPGNAVPFEIRRMFYLFDVPAGAKRGGHAHKKLEQLVFAPTGAFDVMLDDGRNTKTIHMDNPRLGLHICPMTWAEIGNFTSGAVCAVLASQPYDESDYYRDHDDFLSATGQK